MKILYAARDDEYSVFRMERICAFLRKDHDVTIAAYNSSPNKHINLSYLNIPRDYILKLQEYRIKNMKLLDRIISTIKNMHFDLIISDYEIICSIIANCLQIPLWQVSPLAIVPMLKSIDEFKKLKIKNYIEHKTIISVCTKYSSKIIPYHFIFDFYSVKHFPNKFIPCRPYFEISSNSSSQDKTGIIFNYQDICKYKPYMDIIYTNKQIPIHQEQTKHLDNNNFIVNCSTDILTDMLMNKKRFLFINSIKSYEDIINSSVLKAATTNTFIYIEKKSQLDFKLTSSYNYKIDNNVLFLDELIGGVNAKK